MWKNISYDFCHTQPQKWIYIYRRTCAKIIHFKTAIMAKQVGPIFIKGTIGNITFYEMNGKHYSRRKSSLSGNRVKTKPEFENTRRYAGYMKCASQMASAVYRTLRTGKSRELYQRITGHANFLFKHELPASEIETILMNKYQDQKPKKQEKGNQEFVEKVLHKALKQKPMKMEYGLEKDLWVLREVQRQVYRGMKEPAWVYN
jgi:hypothetical protein